MFVRDWIFGSPGALHWDFVLGTSLELGVWALGFPPITPSRKNWCAPPAGTVGRLAGLAPGAASIRSRSFTTRTSYGPSARFFFSVATAAARTTAGAGLVVGCSVPPSSTCHWASFHWTWKF